MKRLVYNNKKNSYCALFLLVIYFIITRIYIRTKLNISFNTDDWMILVVLMAYLIDISTRISIIINRFRYSKTWL